MVRTKYILGLMSGSSLDGLDLALCRFDYEGLPAKGKLTWEIVSSETVPYSAEWKERLRKTPSMSANRLAETDAAFGALLGEMTGRFIAHHNLPVDAIASHGHTVFHFPERGFSTQIGHGAFLAEKVNLPVIFDFRMADIAAGGQGAPLAPLVDDWLFPEFDIFLNLGGIANISAKTPQGMIGFDVIGANQVLDGLAAKKGLVYDKDGALAQIGTVNPILLEQILQLDFLRKPYPKSLGNQWVRNNMVYNLLSFDDSIPNKLATVTEAIALEIKRQVHSLPQGPHKTSKMLVTGGGAHNKFLIERLRHHLAPKVEVALPNNTLINYKEALLMALMGLLFLEDIPNNTPATGAGNSSIGGLLAKPTKKVTV